MDSNHIYFPALPGLPLTFEPLLPEKKEQKKIQVQFVLLTYSLEQGQTPGSSPLKKTVSPTTTRSHQLWGANPQDPYHNF